MPKTPRLSYDAREAQARAEKWASMNDYSKDDLLSELRLGAERATDTDANTRRTAAGRMLAALLAWMKREQIPSDMATTIAAQWAEMGIQRIKVEREARV